jgi:hypothetical protein
MKKIIFIIFIIVLVSCTKNNSRLEVMSNSGNDIISNNEFQNVFWEFDDDEFYSWKNKKERVKDKIKIYWNNNIKFTYCDSLSNYKNKEDFYNRDKDFNKFNSNVSLKDFWKWEIIEYCRTNDFKKYIFVNKIYNTLEIYKYDVDLNIYELVDYKWYFDKRYIEAPFINDDRDYWDISLWKYLNEYIKNKSTLEWFWLKNKNIIPFSIYWRSLLWCAEGCAPWPFASIYQFFSKKTIDYCNSWLTKWWKLSVCFADIFYEYDLIKNSIEEKRVCSYYIEDDWSINKLEKCIDFKDWYKWFNLISKAKGLDFYQNNSWDLSILDIDLNSIKLSFWWVNSIYKKVKEEAFEWYTDKNWVVQIPAILDTKIISKIEYENKNSKLFRFNKFKANEFPNTFSRDFYINNYSLAVINWEFFDQNKSSTFLSFPLKSWWKVINSHVDNDIEKRTFVIDIDWNAKILNWYKNKYLKNDNYRELIVWFSPDVDMRKNEKIWRTYIWIKSTKNVVFFIVKNKNQKEMNKIISDYWINEDNVIMMDWWPSSQFAYFENNWPWSEREQFYWSSKVPHYFIIYID